MWVDISAFVNPKIEHDEWGVYCYANNATVRYNGHVYKNTTGSTQTSGNTPPVHLSGTETYGSINWEYLHDEHGHVKIVGFTSATVVTADVHQDQYGNSRLPDSAVGSSIPTRAGLDAFGGIKKFPKV